MKGKQQSGINKKKLIKKRTIIRRISYLYVVIKLKSIQLRNMNALLSIKRMAQKIKSPNDLIHIGTRYLIGNEEVIIVAKQKPEFKTNKHFTVNSFKGFIGKTSKGTSIYVQPSDICCPIRKVIDTVRV